MGKYPNTRVIQIEKAICDKNNPYFIQNLAANQKAMKELSLSAFKVWCYLSRNQQGYGVEEGSRIIAKECKLSWTATKQALKELQEKNYIYQVSKNYFIFVENGGKI